MLVGASLSNAGLGHHCQNTLWVYRGDFFGREIRRQYDFEQFDVRTVAYLSVANSGWLMNARSGLKPDHALSFVFEFNPALQDVYELEGCIVKVRLA